MYRRATFFVIATFAALLAAACGGSPAPTATPTAAPTETFGGIIGDLNSLPTADPNMNDGLGTLDFNVTISGDVEAAFQAQGGAAVNVDGSRLVSVSSQPDSTHTVMFSLPATIAQGTFTLEQPANSLGGEDYMGASYRSSESGSSVYYEAGVSGILEITSPAPFAATFEFTASSSDGKQVTVSGTIGS